MSGASSPHVRLRDELPRGSRYELLSRIASGGMATVYVGRLRGAEGFWRLVAIKRAHAHLIEDPEFRRVLVREARLASRIHHPNVVSVQDVDEREGELLLIMDFIEGAALSTLLGTAFEQERPTPARVAVRVALDAALGLHAAHELADDDGRPLGLVHRDVSPHNILVGVDGAGRIADFGIAKCQMAAAASGRTATGVLKGKLAYMAPEYIGRGDIDARGDVFALGVVLWEALTNQRLFRAANELETLSRVTNVEAPLVSEAAPWVGTALDEVVEKALEKSPARRFATARAFAEALEAAAGGAGLVATPNEVGDHVRAVAGEEITKRRTVVRERAARKDAEEAADVRATATAAPAQATAAPGRTATVPLRAPAARGEPTPNDAPTERITMPLMRTPAASITDPGSDEAPTLVAMPPESGQTLEGSGISSPRDAMDDPPASDERAARSRRRSRVAVSVVVGALAIATVAVAGSRLVAGPASHDAPAPASSGVASASRPAPSTPATTPPAAVPRASGDGPASEPPVPVAATAPKAVDPRPRTPATRPTARPTTAPPRQPPPDRAPPNPYGQP